MHNIIFNIKKLKCTAKSFSSHPFTIVSVPVAPFLPLFVSSSVFIISTLIIGTFYCLNYTLLLLHLFITRLRIDFVITMYRQLLWLL